MARAKVSGERFEEGLTVGLESQKNAGEMRALGWQFDKSVADQDRRDRFLPGRRRGRRILAGPAQLLCDHRYNRSVMYAMAVHQLSQLLADARGEQ